MFGDFLREKIDQRKLSQTDFCRAVRFKSQGYFSQIIRNERLPPLELIDRWKDELDLTSEEQSEMRALAQAAHLQRKLDHEGCGRKAFVTKLPDGRYAINAITGKGLELVPITPSVLAETERILRERNAELEAEVKQLREKLHRITELVQPTPRSKHLSRDAQPPRLHPPKPGAPDPVALHRIAEKHTGYRIGMFQKKP
jgi:transcriptional regulator with XRE-family HTH domain